MYLRAQLEQLRARFPSVIREVRGKGLMLGLEFTDLADSSPLFRFGIRQGFLSLLVASYLLYHHQIRLLAPLTTVLKGNPGKRRHAVLRLQPAVDITNGDMDRVVQALAEVCLIIERNNEGVLVGHLVGATPDESERRDPPQVTVTVPRLDRRSDFDARVGFIVHPASIDQILRYYLPSLRDVDRKQVAAWWSRLARFLEPDLVHAAYIGANGFRVEANMVAVPYLASDLARSYGAVTRRVAPSRYDVLRLEAIRDKIQDAVTTARELGDEQIPTSVVGLGAYTSIVTDQGTTVNDFEVPVTTGNAYTAGLMLEGIAEAAKRQGLVLARTDAAVVGAAGNIGSVLAVLLAGRVRTLRLVGRDTPDSRARLERTRLACVARVPDAVDRVTVHVSLDAVRSCDIVTVATNSPEAQLIGPGLVKRGAVVSCASVPSNLSAAFRDHLDDFLVFDGGYARLPEGQVIDCIGLPQGGLAFGCLSETLLLGFAGCDQSFARGPIAPEQVEAMLALAHQCGFTLGEFKLNEAPYAPSQGGSI
jgi:predicted amino acid dehydrogenase